MKFKLLVLSALLASIGMASPILCGSDLIPAGNGVGAGIVCPTIGDPGFFVTLVTLVIESDYTGWVSGNPVVKENYAITGPLAFTPVPEQDVFTIPGPIPNSHPVFTLSIGGLMLAPIAGITVTPTSNTVNGVVIGSSAVAWLDYLETRREGQTPEPSTAAVCLIGAGVFLFVGKFRQRQ